MRAGRGLALALVVAAWTSPAAAFPGFYVTSTETTPTNEATTVVLLREGRLTVVSMSPDYVGPVEDFALIVPVPTILGEGDVRTLRHDVFQRLDRLSAPRLVELWEADPCPDAERGRERVRVRRDDAGRGHFDPRGGPPEEVRVEGEFAVGEYDVVILGAPDSRALERWLVAHDFHVPDGAAEAFRLYAVSGMHFFVARVAAERLHFSEGRAILSPIRFHYESDALSIPVRLGLLSSGGTQDLVVHVLARHQRYEAASHENVFVPTNLDVDESAREHFGAFYTALFDHTLAAHPGAVVTEYAWEATRCDACGPDEGLRAVDLTSLGGDIAFPGGVVDTRTWNAVPEVHVGMPTVEGDLGAPLVRRVARRRTDALDECYARDRATNPLLAGELTVSFEIGLEGNVIAPHVEASTVESPTTEACFVTVIGGWTFPEPERVVVHAEVPFVLGEPRSDDGPRSAASDWVLTRLHYRYARDARGEDLVLRPADPVSGGVAEPSADGTPALGVSPTSTNTFQARYVIRHGWAGAVACDAPARGVWAGEHGELARPVATAADLGHTPHGDADLATFVRTPLLELGVVGVPTPVAPEPAVEAPVPAEPVVPAPPPPSAGGCGCAAGPRPFSPVMVVLLVVALSARRRARSR